VIGVLKSALPGWLADGVNRDRVLSYATAQPSDGGGGAMYILLRRQREEPSR
jgi:DNA-nicking Smr family endonuclease